MSWGQETLNFARAVGPISDLGLRILAEAYGRIGIPIRDTGLPAERSLMEANKGAYDGEVVRVAGIGDLYPNLIQVTVPVTSAEGMVFTKQPAIVVDGWESLRPYTIVIRRGLKFAEMGTRGMKVTLVTTYEESFKLVSRGRYDLTVCDRLAGYYFTRKYNRLDVRALEPPITFFHLYHYLHKKHTALIPRITAALSQMRAEGRLREIRTSYIDDMLQPQAEN